MHGTFEMIFRNNVAILIYGNGVFNEEGAESGNTIDHNFIGYSMVTVSHPYYNEKSSPYYGYTSEDYCVASIIWWKNSRNLNIRNTLMGGNVPFNAIWVLP